MQTNLIHTGDCFEVLSELPENSIHAVVTDPPYGLAFMGRDWDDFEPKEYQQWCEEWARDVKRVLKPGGHLLAFSGNRTHHRLFTGVEDAGFEIRDTITWHYGSGFPKASDIGKTIDKRGGRQVKGVGEAIEKARKEKGLSTGEVAQHFADEGQEATGCVWNWENGASNPTVENFNKLIEVLDLPFEPIEPADRDKSGLKPWTNSTNHMTPGADHSERVQLANTEPATDEAKKWDGWKTGLKPATEYVVMARKPFEGATVDCVQEHGTGALNIDGCRVDAGNIETQTAKRKDSRSGELYAGGDDGSEHGDEVVTSATDKGRYPSNVVFGDAEAQRLDANNEQTKSTGGVPSGNEVDSRVGDFQPNVQTSTGGLGDSGGVSRYFYTSKASKAERTEDGSIENKHPTVKPQDLMEWLVTLVSREGQTILDPFCGSGTTCKAAKAKNREFVGIEKQSQWADVARVRVGLTPNDPSVVREDDDQTGLEAYE